MLMRYNVVFRLPDHLPPRRMRRRNAQTQEAQATFQENAIGNCDAELTSWRQIFGNRVFPTMRSVLNLNALVFHEFSFTQLGW